MVDDEIELMGHMLALHAKAKSPDEALAIIQSLHQWIKHWPESGPASTAHH